MYDPEFEKKVKQKMEELKFSPSDTVWTNVEKGIKKDKKRRGPIFWMFAGLLLLSGGIYLYSSTHVPGKTESATISKNIPSIKGKDAASARLIPSVSDKVKKIASPALAIVPVEENPVSTQNKKTTGKKTFENNPDKKTPGDKNKVVTNSSSGEPYTVTADGQTKNEHSEENTQSKLKNTTSNLKSSSPEAISNSLPPTVKDKNPGNNATVDPLANEEIVTAKDPEAKPITTDEHASLLKNNPGTVTGAGSVKDSSKSKIAISKARKLTANRWQFGITGSGGVSSVSNNLFGSNAVADPAAFYYANSLSAPAGGNSYEPAKIHPGVSFSAGMFARKKLVSHLSLSLGLNYHYYSASLQTNARVQSSYNQYVVAYTALTQVGRYYGGSGPAVTYYNNYHFIELPVMVQWTFAQKSRLPISWEAGVVVSHLFESNAYQFHPSTGTYYKDNSYFNKTQWIGTSAILFNIGHRKTIMQLGPQIQYGFGNLLKTDAPNSQRLLFGGLKFSISTNRK